MSLRSRWVLVALSLGCHREPERTPPGIPAGHDPETKGVPARLESEDVPDQGLSGVVDLAVGEAYSCAQTNTGTVWCWGQVPGLRDDKRVVQSSATLVEGVVAKDLGIAQDYAYALESNGRVLAWGKIHVPGCEVQAPGEDRPRFVFPYATPPPSGFIETLTPVHLFTTSGRLLEDVGNPCALESDDLVVCPSSSCRMPHLVPSRMPQLALGRRDSAPQRIPGLFDVGSAVWIYVDGRVTFFVENEDDAEEWYAKREARLPSRPTRVTSSTYPRTTHVLLEDGRIAHLLDHERILYEVPPAGVFDMDAGLLPGSESTTFCVAVESGDVLCWEPFDELIAARGLGKYLEPTKIDGLQDVVQVEVGELFACARLRSGHVKCWGKNDKGQLGIGRATDEVLEPTYVLRGPQ